MAQGQFLFEITASKDSNDDMFMINFRAYGEHTYLAYALFSCEQTGSDWQLLF